MGVVRELISGGGWGVSILDNLIEHVVYQDREMRVLWANRAACESVGVKRKELIGRRCYEVWPRRNSPCPDCPVIKAMQTGEPQKIEKVTPDGRPWLIKGFAVRGVDGGMMGAVEITLEITKRKRAEEALQESEERFREFFENDPEYCYMISPEGIVLDVNRSALRALGYRKRDLVGKPLNQIYAPESQRKMEELFSIWKRTGKLHDEEMTIITKGGERRTVLLSAGAVREDRGGLKYSVSVQRDITERKRAEEELRATTNRLSTLLEAVSDVIYFKDVNGRNLLINKAFEKLVGLKREEILGRTDAELFPPELAEACRRSDELVFKRRETIKVGEAVNNQRGERVYFDTIKSPVFNDKGEVIGLVGVSRDITEHRRMEEALRASEERFRTIFETAQDSIFIKDRDLRYTQVNPAMEKLFGLPAAKLIGMRDEDLFGQGAAAHITEVDHRVLNGEIIEEEHTKPVNGALTTFHVIKVPMRNSSGDIIGLCGIARDITERKQAEKALEESLSLLRATLESTADGILVVDRNGRWAGFNQKFVDMWGVPDSILASGDDEEALAYAVTQLKDPESFLAKVKELYDQPDAESYDELELKDGRIFERYSQPQKIGEETVGRVWSFRDVTERKRAERALKESKEKYRNLVNTIGDLVFTVDPQGKILFANSVTKQFIGCEPEEAIGHNFTEFVHQDDIPLLWGGMRRVLNGEPIEGIVGVDVDAEYRLVKRSGEIVWVATRSQPIRDEEGKIIGFSGLSRDITERKRAEEERVKLEAQLRHAQKMEAVGTLAGGIAHDFNNLLGGILGYSSLLLNKLAPTDPNRKYVELIESASNRAAELTNRLLGFARQGKYEEKPVDINQLIGGVVELLSASIDKRIEIEMNLCGENPLTKGDPNQLEQVLMNLCVNARDAMPDGGELSIGSRLVHLDERFASEHLGAVPGDYVCITVSDTGVGMNEETKTKIFDPFFTTKGQGEGTGLGLSMVYGIVKNHGGYLSVYSEVGKGTTFEVYLPLSQGFPIQPKRREERVTIGSESILVVDDEQMLRDLMKDILEDLGYRVRLASDGEEAVELYRKHRDEIDLVIVDMMMPKMGGRETFQELKRIDPQVKALLASGYSKNTAAQRILDLGVKGFLHKPFSMEEISHKVREVLDG